MDYSRQREYRRETAVNHTKEVAQAIKKAFAETSVKRIIIAVPGNDNNYRVFKKHFGA